MIGYLDEFICDSIILSIKIKFIIRNVSSGAGTWDRLQKMIFYYVLMKNKSSASFKRFKSRESDKTEFGMH